VTAVEMQGLAGPVMRLLMTRRLKKPTTIIAPQNDGLFRVSE
jgi:hypothetical protein